VEQSDKSLTELATDLRRMVVDYAKQETIDPLKSLVRFLGWGLLGAVCLGVGLVLLALAFLRGLQLEVAPHLTGNWSWVPYLVVAVIAGGLIAVLARAIGSEKRRAEQTRARIGGGS
jgi:hypothetical protein